MRLMTEEEMEVTRKKFWTIFSPLFKGTPGAAEIISTGLLIGQTLSHLSHLLQEVLLAGDGKILNNIHLIFKSFVLKSKENNFTCTSGHRSRIINQGSIKF